MALDNYTSIKTAVASNWMHRADLTTTVDDFIDLFESNFNSEMRVREMEASIGTLVTGSGLIPHPTGWLQWKQIKAQKDGGYVNLEPISEELQTAHYGRDSGPARYYKTVGGTTYYYPSDQALTVSATYYEAVTALSATNTTNWLLEKYPGAYLYGALVEAAPYVGDDPRVPVWREKLLETLNRIRNASDRSEQGSQVLRIRPDIKVR